MKVDVAKKKALEYILSRQGRDYLWHDFQSHTNGEGVDWVTGYVGTLLILAEDTYTKLSKKNSIKQKLEKTAEVMASRQQENGGWGFNGHTPADTDSTAWNTMFLSLMHDRTDAHHFYRKNIAKAITFIQEHRKADNGYACYNEKDIREHPGFTRFKDIPVDGWCKSTVDISVVVAKAFHHLWWIESSEKLKKDKESIEEYISNQKPKDEWRSYWWNSNIYATAQVYEEFPYLRTKKTTRTFVKAAKKNNNPLYRALALKNMHLCDQSKYQLRKQIKNIIKTQETDGSWQSQPSLRVPHPSNINPEIDPSRWREDCTDQNRIFTTVTIYDALERLYERNYITTRESIMDKWDRQTKDWSKANKYALLAFAPVCFIPGVRWIFSGVGYAIGNAIDQYQKKKSTPP